MTMCSSLGSLYFNQSLYARLIPNQRSSLKHRLKFNMTMRDSMIHFNVSRRLNRSPSIHCRARAGYAPLMTYAKTIDDQARTP